MPMRAGALRVAKHVLSSKIHFVGLMENHTASEKLLRAQLGLLLPPAPGGHAEREAVFRAGAHGASASDYLRFDSMPAEVQSRIRELNDNDLKLYAYAQQIFAERISKLNIVVGDSGSR